MIHTNLCKYTLAGAFRENGAGVGLKKSKHMKTALRCFSRGPIVHILQ